ncbi:MAG: hypothetical protein AB2392_12735 [Neobacillus sp.]
MNEHQNSFPNVNLKGKLQKQKGEVDAYHHDMGSPIKLNITIRRSEPTIYFNAKRLGLSKPFAFSYRFITLTVEVVFLKVRK